MRISSKIIAVTIFAITFLYSSLETYARFTITPLDTNQRQFSFELNPGDQKIASLYAANLSNEPLSLRLYSADATQSSQGTFALTTLDNPQINIGKWVTFPQSKTTLNAEEEKEIPFQINIPKNTPPGIYAGGIAAENISTVNNQKNSVAVASRMVVKLFVTVPGGKTFDTRWDDFSAKIMEGNENTKGGKPPYVNFNFSYTNNGNTIVIIEPKIELDEFFIDHVGIEHETITLPNVTLLQNQTISVPVPWRNKPNFGYLKAKATITFYQFDSVQNKKIDPKTFTKELSINFITWEHSVTVGIVITMIVLLITFIILALKISKKRAMKKLTNYVIQDGDTIESIAQKHEITWEKLAKINHIPAPYTLKVDTKILVPISNPTKNVHENT